MVGFNDFALTLGNDVLELLSLSQHLLFLCVKLFRKLDVFLKKGIPFTSALFFFPLEFLH